MPSLNLQFWLVLVPHAHIQSLVFHGLRAVIQRVLVNKKDRCHQIVMVMLAGRESRQCLVSEMSWLACVTHGESSKRRATGLHV